MDGFKEQLKYSIQFRLALWLSIAIVGVAVVAGFFSFANAQDEAHELQDDILRQVAALVRRQPPAALTLGSAATDADPESNLIVQPFSNAIGHLKSAQGLALPASLPDGLQTVRLQDVSYRVLVTTLAGGERIAIAQDILVRDEIAHDSALRTVLPLLILVPILLAVAAVLVRKMIGPVTRLAAEIDGRSDQELHPLRQERLPSEIRPFVTAINRLLGRVAQSMETQRRFIADAAHELRSPMTALSLQAERLADTAMPPEARVRFNTLRQGIERGRRLLEQLLSLARAQTVTAIPAPPLSVPAVFRRVLEDLMPLAEAKGIDIGVTDGAEVQVQANEFDLLAIVKNLVDNAIRYTPAGGRVDLTVSQTVHQVVIEVEDNGIGIPEHERQRVLDPFYRVLGTEQAGSGLGLSIVKTIVERLNGHVELGDATQFQRGLKVRIVLAR